MSAQWGGMPDATEAAPRAIAAYLAAYGPATPKSFRTWLGGSRIAKRLLDGWWSAASDLLAEVDVDGDRAFVLSEDLDALVAARPSRSVRLLGGFDGWVLGPGTDDPHVVPPARRREVSRQSGWISPVAVAGGVVAGTWKLDGEVARLSWFREAGRPPRRALAQQVERIASVMGRPLKAEVTVG
jgi:hypothetical protein